MSFKVQFTIISAVILTMGNISPAFMNFKHVSLQLPEILQ